MKENTRQKLAQLHANAASYYGVGDVTQKFSIDPSRAQTVIERQKQSSDFLQRINTMTVTASSGDVIGLDVTGLVARRTNTNAGERVARSVHSMVLNQYDTRKLEFDTAIKYEAMDAWAQQQGFGDKIRAQTDRQIALNKIMIGFNGMGVANVSDPITNPKGEDLASGWFHKLETRVPGQYLTEGETAGQIKIGDGGDYANLDLMVTDLMLLLDPAFLEANDLVAIVGQQLLSHEKSKFYAAYGNRPSEKSKVEDQQVIGTYGGLPAYKVPYFPSRGLLITSFSNMSIYVQGDSLRQQYIDNPRRDQYEQFHSENLDYVFEDLGKVVAAKGTNIVFKQPDGSWA